MDLQVLNKEPVNTTPGKPARLQIKVINIEIKSKFKIVVLKSMPPAWTTMGNSSST